MYFFKLRKEVLLDLARGFEIFIPRAVRKPSLVSEKEKISIKVKYKICGMISYKERLTKPRSGKTRHF